MSKVQQKFPTICCPVCGCTRYTKAGSILAAAGRVQRFRCKECDKKYHPSLKAIPYMDREGYFDIETSQAGRGAGNFGIIYSWAILDRDKGKVYGDYIKERSLKEEKRVVKSLLKAMRMFDRLYTWYGTHHDMPVSRSRAEYHRLDFPSYREVYHTDLYYPFKSRFRLHSNRQDAAAEFFGMPPQKHTLKPEVWVKAAMGNKGAIKNHIWPHNVEDVFQMKHIHDRILKYLPRGWRSA